MNQGGRRKKVETDHLESENWEYVGHDKYLKNIHACRKAARKHGLAGVTYWRHNRAAKTITEVLGADACDNGGFGCPTCPFE